MFPNFRFHAVYWPAFLMAAGLPLPKKLFVHGHWMLPDRSTEGSAVKMSKSLGNVIDPMALNGRWFEGNADPLRYFVLKHGKLQSDALFSETALIETYNDDLADKYGNLISRVFNQRFCSAATPDAEKDQYEELDAFEGLLSQKLADLYEQAAFPQVIELCVSTLAAANRYISAREPWKKLHDRSQLTAIMNRVAQTVHTVNEAIEPIIPATNAKVCHVLNQYHLNRTAVSGALFPRILARRSLAQQQVLR